MSLLPDHASPECHVGRYRFTSHPNCDRGEFSNLSLRSSYYILIIKFYKLCLLLSVPPFQKIKFWCSLFHKFMVLVYHNLKFYIEKQDSVRIVEVKTSVFLKVRS